MTTCCLRPSTTTRSIAPSRQAGPIATEYPLMETPLLTLLKELGKRPTIKSFSLQQA